MDFRDYLRVEYRDILLIIIGGVIVYGGMALFYGNAGLLQSIVPWVGGYIVGAYFMWRRYNNE